MKFNLLSNCKKIIEGIGITVVVIFDSLPLTRDYLI